jgi:hypothetical protein
LDRFLSPAARLKACTTIQFSKTSPILRRNLILPLACDPVNLASRYCYRLRVPSYPLSRIGRAEFNAPGTRCPRRRGECSRPRPSAQVVPTRKLHFFCRAEWKPLSIKGLGLFRMTSHTAQARTFASCQPDYSSWITLLARTCAAGKVVAQHQVSEDLTICYTPISILTHRRAIPKAVCDAA